jgi:N-methylhydantoinase A
MDARIAVDIGGTFTDVAVEYGVDLLTAKTQTTPANPVGGVMAGIALALTDTDLKPEDVSMIIHGTTLATNALIERKGAKVAAITTEGFRDILEIALERRYDQYDPYIDKPPKLIERDRCYTVPGRIDADGSVYQSLDESAIEKISEKVRQAGIESIAVTLLHSYANPEHELRVRELLLQHCPELSISLSSEVCPEVGEYDRLSTTLANAYIRPLMAGYLRELAQVLQQDGYTCPLYIITSGGGMTTLDTAIMFPIRLVESGPSGGAILAAEVARQCNIKDVVSFDMGGTTAKVCLIENGQPNSTRQFEINRAARFIKGSGMPVRIPVIDMIEIGAGGGSIATVDTLGRLNVGPKSAGAEPGPVSYGKGGTQPTVTDADTVIGLLDPEKFAEGRLKLDRSAAIKAVETSIAHALQEEFIIAADGICQIVDENMASAARVHAIEKGKDLRRHTMIAFGGNGPLHATRVAQRTGVTRIIIPKSPGVGSAIGFLSAPILYEVVKSYYTLLNNFDFDYINRLLAEMETEAQGIVRQGAGERQIVAKRTAYIRYRGQGHEVPVEIPEGELNATNLGTLRDGYDQAYTTLYGRPIPGMKIEIMTWSVVVSTVRNTDYPIPESRPESIPESRPGQVRDNIPSSRRDIYLAGTGVVQAVTVIQREDLIPGDRFPGPTLIVEPQTTTFLTERFDGRIDGWGNIIADYVSGEA